MYNQLLVVVQLTTGLVLSLDTAQANDISVYEQIGDLANMTRTILTIIENLKLPQKHCEDSIERGNMQIDTVFTIVESKKSWYQAFADCRSRGLDLASVESKEEYQEILRQIRIVDTRQSYWLSATNLAEDGRVVWMSTGQTLYYNLDNVNYKKLGVFQGLLEPDGSVISDSEVELCMGLQPENDFKMNANTCATLMYYVCENRTTDLPTKTSSEVSKQKKIFTVVTSKQVNWFDALVDCKRQGLSLATIESEEQQQHVVDLIKSEVGHMSSEVSFWLSGCDLTGWSYYVWMTTGERLHYNAWYHDWRVIQPSHIDPNIGTLKNCLVMRKEFDFKWNEQTCYEENFYICDNQN